MSKVNELKKMLGNVRENFDISPHITLRSHTVAEFFYIAENEKDLIRAHEICRQLEIPFFVIGGGSNLAILKKKLAGLTVKYTASVLKIINVTPRFTVIEVSGGYPVTRLVNETVNLGLSGFEYHLGLPGTVGGAIYMNSKWTKPLNYFGDNLIGAKLLTAKNEIKKVDRHYFHFAYDTSILQKTKEIVLTATFELKKEDREMLKKRAKDALAYRHQTQPFGVATSGCFFRNVEGRSSGYLIDKAGLKDLRVGAFIVSPKHANFIINTGNGQPQDLRKMLKIVKDRVKNKFGVELKEEVIII